MEELASQWNNFSLSEKEKASYTFLKEQRSGKFILAAEFLTPRFLNMEAMARTFKQLWRSTMGFKIRNQNEHRVLFVFDNLGDINRIIQNQPWSFDKHLVMLQRYNLNHPVQDLVFLRTKFWFQVHDIPARCYLKMEVAENICEIIGKVQKSTKRADEEGGYLMRVSRAGYNAASVPW
uniref:DUF4283 domain-containing protein n=1 Tax=Quercus lobata TaxID=97700 RepID=A0A7N2RAU6_QUELO